MLEALRGRADDPEARRLAERLGGDPAAAEARRPARPSGGSSRTTRCRLGEKLLSLFEPHTQVIPRFKAGKPVEFGRKLRLDEVEGGIITGYAVLEQGGGQDQPYLADALAQPPAAVRPGAAAAGGGPGDGIGGERAAGEGGGGQAGGVAARRQAAAGAAGGGEGPAVPARVIGSGPGSRDESTRCERDYGLKRCRYHGERGMGRWVGWGIVAHNLSKVAEAGAAGEPGARGGDRSDPPSNQRFRPASAAAANPGYFAPQTSTRRLRGLRRTQAASFRKADLRRRPPARTPRRVARRRARLPLEAAAAPPLSAGGSAGGDRPDATPPPDDFSELALRRIRRVPNIAPRRSMATVHWRIRSRLAVAHRRRVGRYPACEPGRGRDDRVGRQHAGSNQARGLPRAISPGLAADRDGFPVALEDSGG